MSRINWDRARIEYQRDEKPLRVVFRARFGSTCVICQHDIEVNTPIASVFVDGKRRYGHGKCVYGP